MAVVPFTSRPNQSQPIPKVDQTFLMMAAAELHEAGRLVEPTLMLKTLRQGEWGTPAELYKGYKDSGLSSEEAREKIMKSLTSPTGSVEGGSKEDAEEQLRKQPMS